MGFEASHEVPKLTAALKTFNELRHLLLGGATAVPFGVVVVVAAAAAAAAAVGDDDTLAAAPNNFAAAPEKLAIEPSSAKKSFIFPSRRDSSC